MFLPEVNSLSNNEEGLMPFLDAVRRRYDPIACGEDVHAALSLSELRFRGSECQ